VQRSKRGKSENPGSEYDTLVHRIGCTLEEWNLRKLGNVKAVEKGKEEWERRNPSWKSWYMEFQDKGETWKPWKQSGNPVRGWNTPGKP
jgi:hypothetical protein